jgi:hypothetical protein
LAGRWTRMNRSRSLCVSGHWSCKSH